MKQIKDGLWWKPFGTLINCINSKGADCIKNIDKDECMRICENDPSCQLGYHVRLGNQKYCACISTAYQWANTNPLTSVIPSRNNTLLSTDKGVEWTGFYNEKRFVPFKDLPKEFPEFIFSGMRVFLRTADEKSHSYITNNLALSTDRRDAKNFNVVISQAFIFDFFHRIGFGTRICLFDDKTFLHLSYNESTEQLEWKPVFSNFDRTSFRFEYHSEKEKYTFVNHLSPFHLFLLFKGEKLYFHVKNDRLVLSNTEKSLLCFEINFSDSYNQYKNRQFSKEGYTDFLFSNTLDSYLCSQYNCHIPFYSENNIRTAIFLKISVLIMIVGLIYLKYNRIL